MIIMAQKHYETTSVSEAVLNSISDYLILPAKEQVLDYNSIANYLSTEFRSQQRKVSLRIPPTLLNAIEEIRQKYSANLLKNTTTEVLIIMISKICTSDKISQPEKLINLMGSKWNSQMQEKIQHIFSTCNRHWTLSVETCAGALGIHSIVNAADNKVLNDFDHDKMNLYRCIQKNPRKLLNLATTYEVNLEKFTELKKSREQALKDCKRCSRPNYKDAVRYLYLNINSYRNQMNTFSNNTCQKNFFRRLRQIMAVHKLLDGVSLHEMDIFKILKKYKPSTDTLFIVDPPYLMCSGYENSNFKTATKEEKKFGLQEHIKLAKELQTAVNNGNDFIYFCRITATRKKDKLNQIILSPAEIKKADNTMKFYIDQLYKGHNFYYTDVKLDNEIIERIITSFPFENGKQY